MNSRKKSLAMVVELLVFVNPSKFGKIKHTVKFSKSAFSRQFFCILHSEFAMSIDVQSLNFGKTK